MFKGYISIYINFRFLWIYYQNIVKPHECEGSRKHNFRKITPMPGSTIKAKIWKKQRHQNDKEKMTKIFTEVPKLPTAENN